MDAPKTNATDKENEKPDEAKTEDKSNREQANSAQQVRKIADWFSTLRSGIAAHLHQLTSNQA